MINLNYQKRKNLELFKSFENPELLNLSKTQNYIPIYNRHFNLNETNFNNVNLNNKWFISSVEKSDEDNIFKINVKDSESNNKKKAVSFFKMAPLIDPYKYLIGRYVNDSKIFELPSLHSTVEQCNEKVLNINNCAYVDGFFMFLSSQMLHKYKFVNGLDYYGSFLAIKNDFVLNVADDIDYLSNSEFFNKNKNILFKIDNYEHLCTKLKPIVIGDDISIKSISSINDAIFEDIFEDNNAIDLNDLKNMSMDLVDITNVNIICTDSVTLKSKSSCSSRSSHTNDDDDNDCENCDGYNSVSSDSQTEWVDCDEDEDEDEDEDFEEERINVTIPKFPIQLISMECCDDTFDNLILCNELTNDEWLSAFMQIIMTLIAYQKAFNFTHNDLHTNNVMYIETDKKYLYYLYKNNYYKVPTYGRIFKIIDFGRSIYKFNGEIFCSDSFQNGGDAATQYNTEPFFNDKKPRLEPNFSFDLCRLACSIFDYVINPDDEIKKINDPVKKIIYEWCLDDKGINMLYKNNGVERYPEFKLYKMIARCVHKHTPQAQLDRPEFEIYKFKPGKPLAKSIDATSLIDIDSIPIMI